jgi:hypothetical protein
MGVARRLLAVGQITRKSLVEPMGFEPTTSTVQTTRPPKESKG